MYKIWQKTKEVITVMKRNMIMRIVSTCMIMVFIFYSVPVASAVGRQSPQNDSNTIYLQRDTCVEEIELPAGLSLAEKAKATPHRSKTCSIA